MKLCSNPDKLTSSFVSVQRDMTRFFWLKIWLTPFQPSTVDETWWWSWKTAELLGRTCDAKRHACLIASLKTRIHFHHVYIIKILKMRCEAVTTWIITHHRLAMKGSCDFAATQQNTFWQIWQWIKLSHWNELFLCFPNLQIKQNCQNNTSERHITRAM